MKLDTEPYALQSTKWPTSGRHILAQFDEETIVVYQAYRPAIGRYAAIHGYFGGEFSYGRMSWIKPNFLWMMYRNGWGTKRDQQVTLAVRMTRKGFDEMLRLAVHSSFTPEVYADEAQWRRDVRDSEVRLQWDPDHSPSGCPLERRAIQLGLRASALRSYGNDWIVSIDDISTFVSEQRENIGSSANPDLLTPSERVYPIANSKIAKELGIGAVGE